MVRVIYGAHRAGSNARTFHPSRHARPCATSVRHGLCLKRCTALILLDSRRFRISWTRERTKAVRCQNIVFHGILKHVPWAVVDRLEEQHEPDRDPRAL